MEYGDDLDTFMMDDVHDSLPPILPTPGFFPYNFIPLTIYLYPRHVKLHSFSQQTVIFERRHANFDDCGSAEGCALWKYDSTILSDIAAIALSLSPVCWLMLSHACKYPDLCAFLKTLCYRFRSPAAGIRKEPSELTGLPPQMPFLS